MTSTPLRIPATDGFSLGATLFEPASQDAPIVLINSATGVKRGFYEKFAGFLAEAGFGVVTYDYRGIGDSRPSGLRGFRAQMREWGACDLRGVIDWIGERYPGRRIIAIGHSVGGQILGLTPNSDRISAVLAVGAQSGWWGHWPRPKRYVYAFLWHVAMPGAARILGYFPSKRFGFGEDLPEGVAREWARWCRNPSYMIDGDGNPLRPYFDRFDGPMLAISIADDGFAPQAAVVALASCYTRARKFEHHLLPGAVGLPSLGHFGLFRERARVALWPHVVEWLRQPTPRPLGAQPEPTTHAR